MVRVRFPALSLLLLAQLGAFPAVVGAHGGGLDSLGCHHNRKAGGYHCHRGDLAGRSFASKAEAVKALEKKSGKSAEAEKATTAPPANASSSTKAKTLTAAEAKKHIGETATVCGKVVSARYAEGSRGSPTFLNLDKPHPDSIFTVVIWGSERDAFGQPEEDYHAKAICVTGRIEDYKGTPQMVVASPKQIALRDEKKP
ncbi:MAG: YHYH domain-containing protein [Acidobacteria bacterium]|nr:YHYH domain-containing protein [Acidobacteriota bacterium]